MTAAPENLAKRNRKVGLLAGGIAAAMVGLAFAAVPLYDIFCKVTGYDGTPIAAKAGATQVLGREMHVRFDANVSNIAWSFKPVQKIESLKVGEQKLAFYEAQNLTARTITGIAAYNVTPEKAAPYFKKIQCFCFDSQTLKPGEKVEMPVVYYIDPKIKDDRDMDDVSEIVLSYTFFEQEKPDSAKS